MKTNGISRQALKFACKSFERRDLGRLKKRWKYQPHVGHMNSEEILDHDYSDVQEFGVLRLHFILFCLVRRSFSGVIWHCNGLCLTYWEEAYIL